MFEKFKRKRLLESKIKDVEKEMEITETKIHALLEYGKRNNKLLSVMDDVVKLHNSLIKLYDERGEYVLELLNM